MSFEPFKFKLNPPVTVPEPSRVDIAPLSPSSSGSAQGSESNASQLTAQVSALAETSKYLQDAIVQRFGATGIEVDLAANPDVAMALSKIYGTGVPPNIVTIPMFSNLLDGEAAIAQMELTLGPDSDLQPNPVQASDFATVTNTVEGLLADNGQFQFQLPGMLRSLKADQMVFQNWTSSLQQYPVMRAGSADTSFLGSVQRLPDPNRQLIPARSLDMSDPLAAMLSGWSRQYSANYASLYGFLAGVSSVDQTISDVVRIYIAQPVQDIVRVAAILNGLKGLFHKNALKDSADILTTFVYARLASDLGGLAMLMDRYVNMAASPLKNAVGSLGHLLSTVNRAASAAGNAASTIKTVGRGGVPGLPSGNVCTNRPHSQNTTNNKPGTVKIPGLDTVSQSLQVLGQHLNWATSAADRKNAKIQESLQKLLQRKNRGMADKLDTLCSLQSLDSLITLATSVVRETQNGAAIPGGTPDQKLATITRILSEVQSGAGTPFVVQGSQVMVVPPELPPTTPAVDAVLKTGGLQFTTPADLLRVNGVLNAS